MSAHRILAAMKHLPRKLALIWRVARECSPDRRGRLVLRRIGLALYLAQAFPGRQLTLRNVPLRIVGRKYHVTLTHFGDFSSLDFILVKGIYNDILPVDRKVKHIIDIGAHIGISTLFWYTWFPDASIVAVEPAPQSFDALCDNVHQYWRRIVPLQGAIADGEGHRILREIPGESQSNHLIDAGTVRRDDIRVKTIPLSRLLIPDCLVAFNCEGSEYEIFPALELDDWATIAAAVGMVHRTTPLKEAALYNLFAAQGFDVTVHRAPEPCQQFILTAVRPKEATT